LLGADVIVTKNFNIKVLEVNTSSGMYPILLNKKSF
jgi:D-alanine-D-alanine ligase-like ATP-grasp enzyme